MPAANDEGPDAALARLNALRAEHKPIMDAIVADVGMAPSTRALLVAHLLEEEDERLAEVEAALDPNRSPRAPSRGATACFDELSTNGSLSVTEARVRVVPRRGVDGAPAGAGLTVGSMRRPITTSTAWRRDR